MSSTLELSKVIGQHYTLVLGSLEVTVKVVDTRVNYGRVEYRVTPLAGSGMEWKVAERLIPVKQTQAA